LQQAWRPSSGSRRTASQQQQKQCAVQAVQGADTPSTSGGGGGGGGSGFFEEGQEGSERQRLFNTIAPVYDQLNDQLSLGLHRVWKRMAVKWSGARTGARALDVCCGSGDLAFRLGEAVGPSGSVVGLDFSANMLADAARRQQQRREALGPAYDMQWVQVGLAVAFHPPSLQCRNELLVSERIKPCRPHCSLLLLPLFAAAAAAAGGCNAAAL
jgi:SAM-dependent methyltransferase